MFECLCRLQYNKLFIEQNARGEVRCWHFQNKIFNQWKYKTKNINQKFAFLWPFLYNIQTKLNRKTVSNESIQTLCNILLSLRTETLQHFLSKNLSDLMIFRERYRERVEQQGQEQRINIIRGWTERNITAYSGVLNSVLGVVQINCCSNWR